MKDKKALLKFLPIVVLLMIFFPAHKTGSTLLEFIYAVFAIVVLGYYILIIIRKIKHK